MIVHIPEANVQLMEKFIMLAIKRTISKFAAHVLVKKRKKRKKQNGKLRVGLDPWPLTKAINREHLRFPTAEKIFSQMWGTSYFSNLDTISGYWQIKVDEQSTNLLTFCTPSSRCRFKRFPNGIHGKWRFSEASYFNYFGHTMQYEFSTRLCSIWENFTGTWKAPEKSFLEDKKEKMVWSYIKLSAKLENSRLYFWDTLFRQKVLKLTHPKLKQLLKCSCQGQLMNYRDLLVWLNTEENLCLTSSNVPFHSVTSSKTMLSLNNKSLN